jgi:ATP-dependent RNA helicase DeaD
MVNSKRIATFKQTISDTLAAGELDFMQSLVEQYQQEHDVPALEIAAALARLSIGDKPLLLAPEKKQAARRDSESRAGSRGEQKQRRERGDRHQGKPDQRKPRSAGQTRPPKGMQRYRIEVGHQHEVKPGNIVGAIANEAGLDAQHIGHIDIQTEFSLVDLPIGMPKEVFQDLRKARVCGQHLNIARLDQAGIKTKGGGKKKKGGHKVKKRKKTDR